MCNTEFTIFTLAVLLWAPTAAATVLLIVNTSSFSFDSSEASFAPHVKGSGVSGMIAFGNPADACSSLESSSSILANSSLFLLTKLGNCSFETKVRFAQDAGFTAVIVYNNESGSSLLTMAGNSEGIEIYAVFVTLQAGDIIAEYADDASSEVWILPTYDNTVWSVIVFSMIALLAITAVLITWYIAKRHRERRFGNRRARHDEPCVMSLRIVQAMPSIAYRSVINNLEAVQEACVICLEEYIDGEQLRILPCSHRFHCTCVDAWLTMWRAVCPMCKRDARFEFPDLQVTERTPLLSVSTGGGRDFYSSKDASLSGSPPASIPPSPADTGYLGIPSCSNGMASSSSCFFSSVSNSIFFRPSTAFEDSLEAFRSSPYFTPPSSHNTSSQLLPGSYATQSLPDCSPTVGSPSSLSSGPRNSKSFLNPSKGSRAFLVLASSSPQSCSSQTFL